MKNYWILVVSFFLFCAMTPEKGSKSFSLTVNMSGFRNAKGIVRVGLINGDKGFPGSPQNIIDNHDVTIQDGKAIAVFPQVQAGKYVVAVFHDENNSGKIDMNFMGIPKEGFAFSNNPSLWKLKPSYKACEFSVEKDTQIPLNIKYLL